MQYNEFIPQLFIGFIVLRIDDDGVINRANALTGRFIIMTHALSAAVTVNLVNLSAHRDCLIRHSGSHMSQLMHLCVISRAIISLVSAIIRARSIADLTLTAPLLVAYPSLK